MASCCSAHLPSPARPFAMCSSRTSTPPSRPALALPLLSSASKCAVSLTLRFPPRPPKISSRNSTWVVRAQDDDFEDGGEYEVEDVEDEEEENSDDYETDYEVPSTDLPYIQSDTFVSTEGVAAEMVVPYRINEQEFHKISLHTCDFFIRKVPDPDNDVYDFREMYVTAPDTDVYAIPTVEGKMPKRHVRLTKSKYECIHVTEPPVDKPRSPLYKTEMEVWKVFLMKHYKNRRTDAWNFVLDFEEIYVIDTKTKSISRAKITVNVSGGRYRDRSDEVLIVRDDGTSFRVIPSAKRKTPDEIVLEQQWNSTKETMDNYLRGFRDYDISNWF